MNWKTSYKNTLLNLSVDINEICAPLFRETKIDYFCYVKSFPDGSMLHLTNNAKWLEYYIDSEYFKISTFRNSPQLYTEKFILCSYLDGPAQQIANAASNGFLIHNVIALVEKENDTCEFFQFGSSHTDENMLSFYFTNMDILKIFILYFRDKIQLALDQLIINKILIPALKDSPLISVTTTNLHLLKNELFNKTKRFYFDMHGNYITKQECNCIQWLALGKSAEEIGMILNLSKRTVEKHLDNIKNKLGCIKQSQIIQKAIQIGILF